MNADIIHLVSQYLSYAEKLQMRRACKLFWESVHWSSYERSKMLDYALRHDAPTPFLSKTLRTPVAEADDLYMGLLFVACMRGRLEIAEILLKDTRFDAKARGQAFASACLYERTSVVKAMLADKDYCPLVADGYDRRWMFQSSPDMIKLLLADGRTRHYFNWNHAMENAIYKEKRDVFDFLIQLFRSEPSADYDLVSMLECAGFTGDTRVMGALIEDCGLDPSSSNNLPIRAASRYGNFGLVKQLLCDHRVDPTAGDDLNEAPIHEASAGDHVDIIELLLQDPRVDPASKNNMALSRACYAGACSAVKTLLLDPRVDPSQGALQQAVMGGHTDIVKVLLQDKRVDPSANDNHAICWACTPKRSEMALLFLQDPRVDPSARNNRVVQEVSKNGMTELLKALLKDPRVDASANDNYAIKAARRSGHQDIIALLLTDLRVDSKAEAFPEEEIYEDTYIYSDSETEA
ncbi:hypothetical protein HDU89_005600 [Geranomyces variabilis]|nr:hypothetical protein HDU89_005600 [Geranomyces variabilis]